MIRPAKAIFFSYTALLFFDVAAGYICKMRPQRRTACLTKKSILFGQNNKI